MSNKMLRIAVFMDGNYFLNVNTYYKFYHPKKSNLSFSGIIEYIREEVSKVEETNKRYCQVVEAHWFRGRFSTVQMEQKYPDPTQRLHQMSIERRINDIFMYEGIVQHVYPMQINPKTGNSTEKGIDVWLSLEAFELAILKRFDVLAIIAGDTDYVPLIRKINGLGTRVMVLGWEVRYIDSNNLEQNIFTSQALLDECSYPIMMNNVIEDKSNKNNQFVNGIFANN